MAKRWRVLNRKRRRNSREFHYCEFEYRRVLAYEGDPHYSATKRGCDRGGIPCYLPSWGEGFNEPDGHYCGEHREIEGFCVACGIFSAGIERFEFGPYAGYCENCADEAERDDRQWEPDYYDEDDDYDGSVYDFAF